MVIDSTSWGNVVAYMEGAPTTKEQNRKECSFTTIGNISIAKVGEGFGMYNSADVLVALNGTVLELADAADVLNIQDCLNSINAMVLPKQDAKDIIIYVDGSCLGNPGPGGWAVLVLAPNGREMVQTGHSGGATTTSNRMELSAIAALYYLFKDIGNSSMKIKIHSDSQYSINSVTRDIKKWKRNGWRTSGGEPVKNIELIKIIDVFNSNYNVTYKKVKGHAGDPYNERVDKLAKEAAKKGCM